MDVLTQLNNLTSLRICMEVDVKDSNNNFIYEVDASYTMDLPGLKSLHMTGIEARDLILLCPRLRSLTVDYPFIKGKVYLPASLEDLSVRGMSGPPMHEPYQISDLLGLTSLLCHACGPIDQDQLYATLPSMSALKTLILISLNGKLPPLLPASLRVIKYILDSEEPLSSKELQHLASPCLLPEVQAVSLYNHQTWKPSELRALQKIKRESKVAVIVKENWADEDNIVHGITLS